MTYPEDRNEIERDVVVAEVGEVESHRSERLWMFRRTFRKKKCGKRWKLLEDAVRACDDGLRMLSRCKVNEIESDNEMARLLVPYRGLRRGPQSLRHRHRLHKEGHVLRIQFNNAMRAAAADPSQSQWWWVGGDPTEEQLRSWSPLQQGSATRLLARANLRKELGGEFHRTTRHSASRHD